MKDVIITLKGIHGSADDGEDDVIELVTDGTYSCENGDKVVTYMESELTGLEGTKTTLRVADKDKTVTLTREGSYNSQMVFEEGKRHFFLYDTPYGAATMGVDTQKINAVLDEHGGDMEIFYAIDIENVVMGRKSFTLNVREIKNPQ